MVFRNQYLGTGYAHCYGSFIVSRPFQQTQPGNVCLYSLFLTFLFFGKHFKVIHFLINTTLAMSPKLQPVILYSVLFLNFLSNFSDFLLLNVSNVSSQTLFNLLFCYLFLIFFAIHIVGEQSAWL